MDYHKWQQLRRDLMEREKSERSVHWEQSRAPIQAAITEQAVRELFDRVEALEAKVKPNAERKEAVASR